MVKDGEARTFETVDGRLRERRAVSYVKADETTSMEAEGVECGVGDARAAREIQFVETVEFEGDELDGGGGEARDMGESQRVKPEVLHNRADNGVGEATAA